MFFWKIRSKGKPEEAPEYLDGSKDEKPEHQQKSGKRYHARETKEME